MGYKMKGFSGFKSPAKQTQGISGDQVLINAQKNLSAEESSYKAPGWARMATSILPGHDPTGQGKGRKKAKASGGAAVSGDAAVSGGAAGGGGVMGGIKEAQGAYDKFNEIKDFDWQGAFTRNK